MDPNADATGESALELSLRHTEFLDPKQGRDLASYRERGSNSIRELAGLHRQGLNIEVRLHREPVRFKMHMADDARIWLEVPRKGRHPSNPAHYHIEPVRRGGLYDHYSSCFESIWLGANPVDLGKHHTKGAGQ